MHNIFTCNTLLKSLISIRCYKYGVYEGALNVADMVKLTTIFTHHVLMLFIYCCLIKGLYKHSLHWCSPQIQEFGVTETRELVPNGANILVTDENKREYVKLVCQMKMRGAIRQQLNAFLEGFYDIIPKKLVSIFTEQELELLISGLPTIDIDDLKANTEYHKYQATSLQVCYLHKQHPPGSQKSELLVL